MKIVIGLVSICRMIILRRLFVIAAALYFLRSVTMLVTSLPVATQLTDCQPKVSSPFLSLYLAHRLDSRIL